MLLLKIVIQIILIAQKNLLLESLGRYQFSEQSSIHCSEQGSVQCSEQGSVKCSEQGSVQCSVQGRVLYKNSMYNFTPWQQ